MKLLKKGSDIIGAYTAITEDAANYYGDDVVIPKAVVGTCTIEDGELPVDLTPIKAAKWEEIKKYRDNLVENGGFKVGAHWYHSNLLSRTQYISLVMMGANIPAGTVWKTLDNGYVSMTQTLAGQIFAAGAAQDAALFAKAAEHKTALDASSDPANYDYTTGWPETYTGD